MFKLMNDKRGFTLVELMITVVIVGVLASVAIPLYQANVKRAKASEADATLGSIRTALRVYYAENSNYPTEATAKAVHAMTSIDMDSLDMVGKYFAATTYTYISAAGVTYTIKATGAGASAGINRQMITDGTLSDF